jgi:hypothetical protein
VKKLGISWGSSVSRSCQLERDSWHTSLTSRAGAPTMPCNIIIDYVQLDGLARGIRTHPSPLLSCAQLEEQQPGSAITRLRSLSQRCSMRAPALPPRVQQTSACWVAAAWMAPSTGQRAPACWRSAAKCQKRGQVCGARQGRPASRLAATCRRATSSTRVGLLAAARDGC